MVIRNAKTCVYIIATFLIMFLNLQNVSAKSVLKTCNYTTDVELLAGHSATYKVVCTIYSDYKHDCIVKNISNKIATPTIENWEKPNGTNFVAKDYMVSNNNKCPEILLVRMQADHNTYIGDEDLIGKIGQWFSDQWKNIDWYGDQIFAAKDSDMYRKIYEDKVEVSANWYRAYIDGFEWTDDNVTNAYTHVESSTKHIKEETALLKETGFEGSTSIFTKAGALLSYMENSDNQIDSDIQLGVISEDDSRVKKYREAVKTAQALIESFQIAGLNEDPIIIADGEPIRCSDFIVRELNERKEIVRTYNIIEDVFGLIMIAAPILLIIFGVIDFAKATLASDEQALKKAGTDFGKRTIAAVLLFVLPLIINLLLSIAFNAGVFGEMPNIPETCIR